MSKQKARVVKAGEAVYFTFEKKHFIVCCDCELTHSIRITPAKKGVVMQFWRDKRRTSQSRRRCREKQNHS